MSIAITLVLTALFILIAWGLRPPPCPGCRSRRSVALLLEDSVVCAGCGERLA